MDRQFNTGGFVGRSRVMP